MSSPLQQAIDSIGSSCDYADPKQALVGAKVSALMVGYDARWKDAPYIPVAVEETLVSDLYNIETGAKSRTFKIAGKLDVIVMDGSRRLIMDHKTTGEDIDNPDSSYWRQLVIDGQVSHYFLLSHMNGMKIDGAVWDRIRRPSIRPKNVSKADLQQVVITKKYFGYSVSDESIEELQQTSKETLEMYQSRLVQDCVTERPQWYFQRRGVPRLDSDLHEYARELWDEAQELIVARREKRWTRNSGACLNYQTPCRYLGLCSSHDTTDSSNWTTKSQVHSELPNLAGDGRDILTNSRLSTFRLCHRKHFYAYEVGIERTDEEEREVLFFGNLIHTAQEAWWLAIQKQHEEKTNGNQFRSAAPNESAITANQAALTL